MNADFLYHVFLETAKPDFDFFSRLIAVANNCIYFETVEEVHS